MALELGKENLKIILYTESVFIWHGRFKCFGNKIKTFY